MSEEKITVFAIKGNDSSGTLAVIDNTPDALLKFIAVPCVCPCPIKGHVSVVVISLVQ